VAQSMKFESKEPALLSLTKVRAILSQQLDSPMSQGVAQRNRL
jgi:hypothetical protein